MLEVEPAVSVAVRPPEVAQTAMKPLVAQPQKHLLGGCTIDIPRLNRHWQRVISFHHAIPCS